MRCFSVVIFLLMVVLIQAQNTKPIVSFSLSDTDICAKSSISVSDSSTGNISNWNWSFEGGNPASSENKNPGNIFFNNPGIYKIVLAVTYDNGDIVTESQTIHVRAVTPALFTVVPNQGVAPLNVQISTNVPANQCLWHVEGMSFSDMSALSHVFMHSGTSDICLVTENTSGCRDSACVDVIVWEKASQDSSFLAVPNVFTPNSDLQNDIFRTTSLNIIDWDTRIYNRLGQLVYKSSTPDIMWDGMNSGNPCDVGVYVYIIKAVGSDGKLYDISGTLTLFR